MVLKTLLYCLCVVSLFQVPVSYSFPTSDYTYLFNDLVNLYPRIQDCRTVITHRVQSNDLLNTLHSMNLSVIQDNPKFPAKKFKPYVRSMKNCYFSVSNDPKALRRNEDFSFTNGLADHSLFNLMIKELSIKRTIGSKRKTQFLIRNQTLKWKKTLRDNAPRTLHTNLLSIIPEDDSKYGLYITCVYTRNNFQMQLIDIWKKERGFLKHRLELSDFCNKSSLDGLTLRVNYVPIAPYIMGKDPENLIGVDIALVKEVSHKYNFNLTFTRTKAWGSYYEESNSSTGLIKELVDDNTDLGIGTVAYSYHRHLVVRYTGMIYMQSFDYICIKPKPLDPYQNIIRPFSHLVWLITFLSAVGMSLIFYIFHKTYGWINRDWIKDGVPLNDFFLMTFGNLVEQGELHWYKNWGSARILVVVWKIFCILMIFSFCCNLRAMLVKVQYTQPVEEAQDVVDQQRKIFLLGNSLPTVLLETSPIDIHQQISSQFYGEYYYLTKNGIISQENHTAVIKENGCIVYPKVLVDGLSKGIFDAFGYMPYRSAKTPFGLFATGMVSQKRNSPWIKDFTHVVDHLFNAGINIKLHRRYLPRQAYFVETNKATIDPLHISHFLSTIIIWAIGIFISTGIFLHEYSKRTI